MKRIAAAILIVSGLLVASNLSLSTFFITSFDPLSGAVDVSPIFYLTYRASDSLSVKYTQYGNVFDLSDPAYYYVEYRGKVGPVLLNVDLGKARLKKSFTYEMNLVRVGGIKYTYAGVGGYARMGIFEIGGAYDFSNGEKADFGIYGTIYTDSLKAGIYYENSYEKLGADVNLNLGFAKVWSGAAIEEFDLGNFTALVGGRTELFGVTLEGQYGWIGNKYLIERLKSDPNYNAEKWFLDLAVTKKLKDFDATIYFKNNSKWFTDGELPLLAVELKAGDLEIHAKLLGTDLNPNLSGDQTLMVVWNHYFRYPTETAPAKAEVSKAPQKVEAKSVTILEIKKVKPQGLLKVKGIVTVPVNLLGKKSFYMKDPTGGIMVYDPSGKFKVGVGDIVEVIGTFKEYYGMPEIVVKGLKVIGKAKAVKGTKLTGKPSYETLGNLVEIEGFVVRKSKYEFDIQYSDNVVIKVYIKKGTGINIRDVKVGDRVRVTGVMHIYKGNYELLPRFPEDIVIE